MNDTGHWMPAFAGMTTERDAPRRSRDGIRPSFALTSPSLKNRGRREDRVPAAPTAHAQKNCARRALTTGTGGYTPAFPAQWFTAYFVLSPVNQLVCHRRLRRCVKHRRQLGACMGAPGPHDLTVRDKAPLVSQRHPVHHVPPRVRDDRDTPLCIEAGWADHTRICISEKQKYFRPQGLTGFLQARLSGKSNCLLRYKTRERGCMIETFQP
jgi:hypothetical protein